jgi:hypothetical protein
MREGTGRVLFGVQVFGSSRVSHTLRAIDPHAPPDKLKLELQAVTGAALAAEHDGAVVVNGTASQPLASLPASEGD